MGDEITVANEQYYVISVPENEDYVVVLKANPLKTTEITAAGGTVYSTYEDENQTGTMKFYWSETCGNNGSVSGCTTSYAQSEIKSVVDAWAGAKFTDELKTVDGYSARLITEDELENISSEYSWKNSDYRYWTMTPWNGTIFKLIIVNYDGTIREDFVYNNLPVRPVINVYKSKISS